MTTDTIGGVWTFTQELSTGLLERGESVVLVSVGQEPDRKQLAWASVMKESWKKDFHFVSLGAPLEWMQGNEFALSAARLPMMEAVAQFQPDILHANQFCFGALPVSVPVMITAHSDVFSWHEATRSVIPEDSLWITQYRSLVQDGLSAAAGVVAPTRSMLGELEKHFSIPGHTSVIPNGRSIPRLPAVKRKVQAITAGRLWDEAKNVSLLSEINSPMALLVAGDQTCEGCVAPLLGEGITILGHLSEDALFRLFAESAIYICTSLYEPFGLAPLEAGGCGCAIVTRDLPSLREVWGDSALYFFDAATLATLLRELQAYPERLAEAQAKAYARARSYTRDRLAGGYLNIFRQVVGCNEVAVDVS